MIVNIKKEEEKFVPIKVEVTLETREEFVNFYIRNNAKFNCLKNYDCTTRLSYLELMMSYIGESSFSSNLITLLDNRLLFEHDISYYIN